VVWQFVPSIRHKLILAHKLNGYLVVTLGLIANAGAMMMIRHAFGGNLASQSLVGTLFVITTTGLALAYYNVKMFQIDQHRAWMLRTWFYVSSPASLVSTTTQPAWWISTYMLI
jgi:hypothetical protein